MRPRPFDLGRNVFLTYRRSWLLRFNEAQAFRPGKAGFARRWYRASSAFQ